MGPHGNVFLCDLDYLRHLSHAPVGTQLARAALDVSGFGRFRHHTHHPGGALLLQPSAQHERAVLMPFVLGLNHRTAPVDVREKLAVAPHMLTQMLQQLKEASKSDELVCLSTCNRTEVYAQSKNSAEARDAFERVLQSHAGEAGLSGQVSGHLYFHESENAVRHLFSV